MKRCARFLAALGMTTIVTIGMTTIVTILFMGCSRTVTQMPTFGNELNIEITLADAADIVNNRYFVVFSTLEAYNIPLPPPDSLDEFLEPGDNPQPGTKTKADYYSKYYSTWSGYIVIDAQGYSLAKGAFDVSTTSTRELVSTLGSLSNKLNFTVRLERIFGNTLPQKIYIDIISASYPSDSTKILRDRISPPAFNFEPIKGNTYSRTDEQNSNIAPSLDITSFKVFLP